jgi:hypothetical protein
MTDLLHQLQIERPAARRLQSEDHVGNCITGKVQLYSAPVKSGCAASMFATWLSKLAGETTVGLCNSLKRFERRQSERKRVAKSSFISNNASWERKS